MIPLYDDPLSNHYQYPQDLEELVASAPELPLFKEALPFDNRPYIIPLYKPVGISSFDVIRKVRSTLIRHLGKGKGRRKLKVGHFGTLDPFAEGLLLVGTGKAMKLMKLIQEELPKQYQAVGNIGIKTLTGDCDGEVISELDLSCEKLSDIHSHLSTKAASLLGEYWQAPPYFSAVKHEGKPLYEYAREGIFIEKPPVARFIYKLEILENLRRSSSREVIFRSSVSNGTYIRTLWQDILSTFDVTGHLTGLTRDQIGELTLKQSVSPEEFVAHDELVAFSPDQVVKLPRIELSTQDAIDLLQGRVVHCNQWDSRFDSRGWAYYRSHLIGLVKVSKDLEITVDTLLWAAKKA